MNQYSIVIETKEAYKELIMGKPNVVGVGMGYKESMGEISDTLCVIAMVHQKVPRAGLAEEALIPAELNGVRTDVIQVGHLVALEERSDRFRPVPGGVSVEHYKVTAGTLGCVVRDSESGEKLILSDNHVLANSNEGKIGDPILQHTLLPQWGRRSIGSNFCYSSKLDWTKFVNASTACFASSPLAWMVMVASIAAPRVRMLRMLFASASFSL